MQQTSTKNNIFRLILVAVVAIIISFGASAQYTLSSFKGNVQIKRAGKIEAASAGMKVGAFDLIVIGQGASATVFDKASSSEYTRNIPGEISPNSLVFEAKKDAGSNLANIHRNVGIGKNSAEEGKMYVEKGKVTLALENYDPEGEQTAVDASVLAKFIVASLSNKDAGTMLPVETSYQSGYNSPLGFELHNTSAEPLYINVVKYGNTADGKTAFQISELGQPVGCYVILPGHSINRSSVSGRHNSDKHILVATHYYFSIDDLLENLEKENTYEPGAELTPKPVPQLPIYVETF